MKQASMAIVEARPVKLGIKLQEQNNTLYSPVYNKSDLLVGFKFESHIFRLTHLLSLSLPQDVKDQIQMGEETI